MTEPNETAEPSGASGGSMANYQAILDSCLRGSTVEQRFCEPPVAGSTPAAGLCVQWIPVSERLPKYNVDVLVRRKTIAGMRTVVAYRCEGTDCWTLSAGVYDDFDDFYDHSVTHWMPLPAPPADAK